MHRVVILGCAATGKTTLARRLGEITHAPVISLDALWQPHWDAKDVPAFRGLVKQAHAGDNWISEGNFSQATFDLRLPRATLVIWLERPRLVCLWRAISRVTRRDEPHRPGRLAEVVTFIWHFNRINRPRIEALRKLHAPNVPVQTLTSDYTIRAFLSALTKESAHSTS